MNPPVPGLPQQPAAVSVKEEVETNMAAITVTSRVPEFWLDQPRLWFYQVEAILAPQKLADEAKFNLVITKLCKEAIQQVTDILTQPPDTKKYDSLKERLLTVYEESETRQIQKLISEMELGDQRPSQLLRRMRDLARTNIPDDTLKILWQSHLPTAVRGIIAVTESAELDVLARIADKVMETTRSGTISEVGSSAAPASDTSFIISEIKKINERIGRMERTRQRTRDRSQSQSRASSGTRKGKRPDWQCFYHYRYKENARKCIQPCSWKKEN